MSPLLPDARPGFADRCSVWGAPHAKGLPWLCWQAPVALARIIRSRLAVTLACVGVLAAAPRGLALKVPVGVGEPRRRRVRV